MKATATTEIYTLSLHDALPIYSNIFEGLDFWSPNVNIFRDPRWGRGQETYEDRKSTRLNSSHPSISYAVFCLKKKIDSLKDRLKPPPSNMHPYVPRSHSPPAAT